MPMKDYQGANPHKVEMEERKMKMTITDKAILVTGANRGIGQALVDEALERGAKRVYAGTRQPLTTPTSASRHWSST